MAKNFYYDIFINDEATATVGPSSLKQLHISFGVMDGIPVVKAGGVANRDNNLQYINWLEKEVNFDVSFKVAPSKANDAAEPMMIKKLGNNQESTMQAQVCDFCNRSEKEAGKLVSFGNSPLICAECIKRCVELTS